MPQSLPGIRYCPNCNEPMLAVNNEQKCFNCAPSERPKHLGPKPKPVTYTPTEKDFKQLGEPIELPINNTVTVPGKTAQDALNIMKNLPIPNTEQEFKQIKKIIKQLEKLIGD